MMKHSKLKAQLVATAAAALGLSGCGRDQEPEQIVAEPPTQALPAGEDLTERAEPAPAQAQAQGEAAATPEPAADLAPADSDDAEGGSGGGGAAELRARPAPAGRSGMGSPRRRGAVSADDPATAGPGPQVVCGASCGASCGGEPEDDE